MTAYFSFLQEAVLQSSIRRKSKGFKQKKPQ